MVVKKPSEANESQNGVEFDGQVQVATRLKKTFGLGERLDRTRPRRHAGRYDAVHRVQAVTHTAGTTALSSFTYAYDAAGNRTQAVESVPIPSRLPGTITVTTTADEYNTSGAGTGCAVREAIQAANTNSAFGGCPAGSSADVILLPAGTYTLTRTGRTTRQSTATWTSPVP